MKPFKLELEIQRLEYASSTWEMKRPREDRDLALTGSREIKISTKFLPRDGKTHVLEGIFMNGVLEVHLDGAVVHREKIS